MLRQIKQECSNVLGFSCQKCVVQTTHVNVLQHFSLALMLRQIKQECSNVLCFSCQKCVVQTTHVNVLQHFFLKHGYCGKLSKSVQMF